MPAHHKEQLKKLFSSLDYALSNEDKITSNKIMTRFDGFSDWTKEHSERVGQMAEKFAVFLGASKQSAQNFGLAASLHDVGKLNIPKEILNTKSPLEKELFEKFFKNHASDGKKILEKEFIRVSPVFAQTAISINDEHHEKHGGKGYPKGKSGNKISLAAQVVSLCDVFDAMNYSRPYQNEFSEGDVLCKMIDHRSEKLKESFNPILLNSFIAFRLSEYENSNENKSTRHQITPEQIKKLSAFCKKHEDKKLTPHTLVAVAINQISK